MKVIEKVSEMQKWSEAERCAGRRIALVPTMGFLHEGHLSLVREGKKSGDRVVVSLFVNPAQFAPGEDYGSYPRDLERDRLLLERERVDVLFHPPAEAMYPNGHQTHVEAGPLGRFLCGLSRPGHFRGVTTVVAKLFNIVRPHVAIFGLKDYQQFQIVRRMVADLHFDIEIIGHPIVREKDGLAMSSRNAYLDGRERGAARCLHRSLKKAALLVRQGEREAARIVSAVKEEIEREPLARVEYVSLCDPCSLEELEAVDGEALLALAVRIGKARLIDNTLLKA
ncbi:MAG: pantoate--beta-alanine ligase [Deltaproteobacteria bacterium]|nr:pantoate--beta-alanine ligase [Deltaproteobacteria bacterium]MBI3062824.1 pantoate--beta-alanine ligase [Deltaproteobacteria bacterium]